MDNEPSRSPLVSVQPADNGCRRFNRRRSSLGQRLSSFGNGLSGKGLISSRRRGQSFTKSGSHTKLGLCHRETYAMRPSCCCNGNGRCVAPRIPNVTHSGADIERLKTIRERASTPGDWATAVDQQQLAVVSHGHRPGERLVTESRRCGATVKGKSSARRIKSQNAEPPKRKRRWTVVVGTYPEPKPTWNLALLAQ